MDEINSQRIVNVDIESQMKSAFIDYAMSVIVSRALPDVRDGLKPVHRRVLFGMDGLGLDYSSQTKKSARIVGDVLCKYHPHGDSSVYDAMVRLAQTWNQRYPLVFGQGNFGSVDGDSPAAQRYTEAKLEKITAEVLADLDKNTVDFCNNYDDSTQEPTVLPTKIPLLLLNGSNGIAVGMATNMAPHNLSECCDGICAFIDNPDITIDELMNYIKGPDFTTGGIIQGVQGIRDAFTTGRGRVVIRSKTAIETLPDGREMIVVTELPYLVNKREMIQKIAEMVEDKKIEGISNINDETARQGTRVVIHVKKGTNSSVLLNTLFKLTPLQSSFSINNVALVDGRPRTLNLIEIIRHFVDHRHNVVVRRTQFDLDKDQQRLHKVEGLLKALDIIDEVIAVIRGSKTVDIAKETLQTKFGFTEIQADYIVEMRLRQLTGLEREKLQAEYDVLMKNIAYYKEVLSDVNLQMQIIKDETLEIKAKYGDARRSEITLAEGDFNPEDFYPDEDVVVTISHMGYIKRTSLAEYRTQARGGVGAKGSATKDEDFIEHLFVANMHATVLFFTENGRCFWSKVYNIPEGAKTSKGRALANFLELGDDKIKAYIAVKNLNDEEYINNHYVVLVTTQGIIKKTTLEAYSRPRSAGVRAINIREDDHLLSAVLTTGHNQILLASYEGLLVRFEEEKVRPMGKTATGVKGMTIEGDNRLVGVISYDPSDEASRDQSVLVISEHGYGKRTDFDEYRITNRGGKGVRTINITEKTGKLIAIASVTDANDLMLITRTGLTIRLNLSEVHLAGRATQGVKLINLRDTDSLASASVVEHSSEEEQTEVAAAETEPIVNE